MVPDTGWGQLKSGEGREGGNETIGREVGYQAWRE